MRFFFCCKLEPMREGIFGMTIRKTTLITIMFFLLIRSVSFLILYKSKFLELNKIEYVTILLNSYFYTNFFQVICLLFFYLNVYTRKFKQLAFCSYFFISFIIIINFLLCFGFSLNPIMERLEDNWKLIRKDEESNYSEIAFNIKVLNECFLIFFTMNIIVFLDLILYFPIYSFYVYIKDKNYAILDKTY